MSRAVSPRARGRRSLAWVPTLALCTSGLLGACGSGTVPSAPGTPAPASATPTSAATQTLATPAASPGAGVAYATKYFSPPLDMLVPSWLPANAGEDSAHFVTFAVEDGSQAIRIMSPIAIFRPGATSPSPVPKDYVGYLTSLETSGVALTDRETLQVDGHDATVLTGRGSTTLDGSVGCQAEDIPAASCYGFGEEVVLRLAVVTTDDGPLLIWLRLPVSPEPDMAAQVPAFDAFLATVHFADREPEASQAAVATPLDGTYSWTITLADAKAGGQTVTPDDVPTFPWVFTNKLERGTIRTTVTFAKGEPQEYVYAYTVEGDRLVFHAGGGTETYGVIKDADGTLHVSAIDVQDPGDAFVNTVKPWTRLP